MLDDMHKLANEAMTTIIIGKYVMLLKEILKHMFNYPETKKDKLSLKWTGSGQTINGKHPSYLIEYQKQSEMATKWQSSEKFRGTKQNQNDIHNALSNT